jgi:hypothetical protein
MTPTLVFMAGQTVVFLAVCGFALWAARLIAEATDNSTLAVEQAVKAAQDAERTAAEMREMRNLLQTWLEQQDQIVASYRQLQTTGAPERPIGRFATDTVEAQAVLTPQAFMNRSSGSPGPRHARPADSPWSAALRAATSRISREN